MSSKDIKISKFLGDLYAALMQLLTGIEGPIVIQVQQYSSNVRRCELLHDESKLEGKSGNGRAGVT
jgi:hypothetical protein